MNQSRPRQRLHHLASITAWTFLAAVYAIVALSWLWEYDLARTGRAYNTAALTTFLVRVLGAHIALGGIVVLGIALVARRWRYALACVPVVVFLLAPLFARADVPKTPTRADDAVVVMSVNLRRGADGEAHLLRQIADVDPDILVLQEWTTTWNDAIGSELRERYDFEFSVPRADPQGIATYSRLRTTAEDGVQLGRLRYPALVSTFSVGDSELTLYNVHLAMPLSLAAHAEQRRQVATLARLVRREDGP